MSNVEGSSETRAAVDLEWALLLERIARRCRSAEGAKRVRTLTPQPNPAAAEYRARITADALTLAERERPLPRTELGDAQVVLMRVKRGGVASSKELRVAMGLLRAAHQLQLFAAEHRQAHPALCQHVACPGKFSALLSELEAAIDDDGAISDRASPELAEARRRESDLRQDLLRRLNTLMRRYADVLRDQYYAERDGRYVLPVRSDAHLKVHGIVLGSSSSGGTLYVEPSEITEIGNRLSVAHAEVEREEARVLHRLSSAVGGQAESLQAALEACIEADVFGAVAEFGLETEALVLIPTAEPEAQLCAMRHPLLIGAVEEVVPNDIEVSAASALVVSGPNAGGKTVALKALGLATYMSQSAIPVPCAAGSRIGWFDLVLSDIGDDQSVTRSLSTFSAHVQNLSAILARSKRGTLVLLDEVAAGTDPEEGAALAVAVLERLVEAGAAVVVTTHYERLKERAHTDARFINASVGFDMASLAPTFKLWMGVPGPSSALAVASRFGIPPAVVTRAKSLLEATSSAREQLLTDLHAERQALQDARRRAEVELQRQQELTTQLEREREHVRARERERLAREGRELLAEVQRARSELRAVSLRLRAGDVGKDEAVLLRRRIDEAARQVTIGSKLMEATQDRPAFGGSASEKDLRPGMAVLLRSLGSMATVLEPPARGQVRVLAGGMKLLAKVGDLEIATAGTPTTPTRVKSSGQRTERLQTVAPREARRTADITLDLRGERVEDALERVDRFIDDLLGQNQNVGFVLHGHGTGALKSAVRAHLSSVQAVAEHRAAERDEGGDAFTVFWLRD